MPKVLKPSTMAPPISLYSHGMVAPGGGDLVVVAGQVGMDPTGRVAGDDVKSQTRQALENIQAILAAAGCSMRDVIRLQTFLTRAEDIPAFMQVRQEVFPGYFPDGAYPPNTLLVVAGLVRPELVVEIEAMAVKAGRRAPVAVRAPAAKHKAAGRTAPAPASRGTAARRKTRR
jgi:enamine deaminase RidA (YjgF/YER057c/UK114 family)